MERSWQRGLSALRQGVAAGTFVCPVAPSTLIELDYQEPDSALRIATLMDELSLSTSFLPDQFVFGMEIGWAMDAMLSSEPAHRGVESICGPALAMMATSELVIEEPCSSEMADQLGHYYSDYCAKTGFAEHVRHMARRLPIEKPRPEEFPSRQKRLQERLAQTGGKIAEMRKEELGFLASSFIQPYFSVWFMGLPPGRQKLVQDKLASLPQTDDRNRILLESMPAIRAMIDMMTVSGLDPRRKDRTSDVFDLELLVVPGAYADAVVSCDGWIAHSKSADRRRDLLPVSLRGPRTRGPLRDGKLL
jgi:hypothetical protein